MNALGAESTFLDPHFYVPPISRGQGLTNRPEGSNLQYIAMVSSFSSEARAALNDQISSLRRDYGFADGAVVTEFLVSHRTIRTVLKDAVPQLRAAFGVDKVFNLEVSRDEDGSATIYAVAIWQGDVCRASEALDNFLENWWLQRMNAATSDLAFVYKLV